jgi:hypothetical protein
MRFHLKQRGIWKNLGLALAGTPAVLFIAVIISAIIGILEELITSITERGFGWFLFIVAYFISLLYVIYEPKIRTDRKRKEFSDALILHWKWQLTKQDKPVPSDYEIELIQELLIERIKVWAWSDPQLWAECYRNEKYSEDPFDILNELMSWWEEERKKHKNSVKDKQSNA